MKVTRLIASSIIALFVVMQLGCVLLENVGGWDVTGCERDWMVCAELGWDNQDIISQQL